MPFSSHHRHKIHVAVFVCLWFKQCEKYYEIKDWLNTVLDNYGYNTIIMLHMYSFQMVHQKRHQGSHYTHLLPWNIKSSNGDGARRKNIVILQHHADIITVYTQPCIKDKNSRNVMLYLVHVLYPQIRQNLEAQSRRHCQIRLSLKVSAMTPHDFAWEHLDYIRQIIVIWRSSSI